MTNKIDTRAIGLDVSCALAKWLTGAENMHYGLWTGLEVNAGNLGAAQAAYTDKLFELLPPPPARILDIGGGAGVTAAKLLALGYSVDIVIPSSLLADRCRENAPEAQVHECTFEDFASTELFDVCLFSESYQYIPLADGLPKALTLLSQGGSVLIADCFRIEGFDAHKFGHDTVGGGHMISAFWDLLNGLPVKTLFKEDITDAVAPSVDIEQGMFNVLGVAWTQIDTELRAKKPRARWALAVVLNRLMSQRRRDRLTRRLRETTRTAEAFSTHNRYMMVKVAPT